MVSTSTMAKLRAEAASPSTTGSVSYCRAPEEGGYLFRYLYDLPPGQPATNLMRDERQVDVFDMREVEGGFNLRDNGVQLCSFPGVPEDIDWSDEQQVQSRYYPLAERFLKELTGASRVHVFDNTVRHGHIKAQPENRFELESQGQPVGMVHVDYTPKGAPLRLHSVLPDEAEELKKTPFAVIQVWRPLKGPVVSSPLGFVDASTVAKKDLINYKLHFPGRTGYNYAVAENPDHRWYYAKGINTDEAYAFVCYESRNDRARFTPHTGFKDLSVGPGAPPRESIEIRAFCFWEDEPPQDPHLVPLKLRW